MIPRAAPPVSLEGTERDLALYHRAWPGRTSTWTNGPCADVGAYLLGLWGLPASFMEAVALHHTPNQASGVASALLGPLHVADALASEVLREHDSWEPAPLHGEFLSRSGLAADVSGWRDIAYRTRARS